MVADEILAILRCPENRTRLARAPAGLIERLNRRITAGELLNRAGRQVEKPLDEGLIREDGKMLYPVRDGTPVLLVDEAIPLE